MTRSISLFFVAGVVVSAGLLGCATAAQDDAQPEANVNDEPAAEQPAEQQPVEQQPAAEASPITITGTLTYTELPKTKSVEAYLGKEFTLVDASGAEHNLASSDAVSHAELVGRSGQSVQVTCVPYPERQPPPDVSAPVVGLDGGLMPYPAGCTVTALADAP